MDICPVDELPPGAKRVVMWEDLEIGVVNCDGEILAIEDRDFKHHFGINPLAKGDVFVTSGAGGYYRPGIAVAILTEVTPDGGVARVISDPAATDFVSVEPIWQAEAVESAATPAEQELEK